MGTIQRTDFDRLPNKYDGQGPRYTLVAQQDAMVTNLIGRGVYIGYHEVKEGTVQERNKAWIGDHDGVYALDGGGYVWDHEVDEPIPEAAKDYRAVVGTTTVRTVTRPDQRSRTVDSSWVQQ